MPLPFLVIIKRNQKDNKHLVMKGRRNISTLANGPEETKTGSKMM